MSLDIEKLRLNGDEEFLGQAPLLLGMDEPLHRAIANAQLAKAFWGLVDWLKAHPTPGAYALAIEVEAGLWRQGMERPT